MYLIYYMTPVHWVVLAFIFFFTTAILSFIVIKLKKNKAIIASAVVIFISIILISQLSLYLDSKLKKATLSNFKVYQDYTRGKVIFSGTVVNNSQYKLAKVILHVKLEEKKIIKFSDISFFKNSKKPKKKKPKLFMLERFIDIKNGLDAGSNYYFKKEVSSLRSINDLKIINNLIIY